MDWVNEKARSELVQSRANHGFTMVRTLSRGEFSRMDHDVARRLVPVPHHDVGRRDDGIFRRTRESAAEPVISTFGATAATATTARHALGIAHGETAVTPGVQRRDPSVRAAARRACPRPTRIVAHRMRRRRMRQRAPHDSIVCFAADFALLAANHGLMHRAHAGLCSAPTGGLVARGGETHALL